MRTTLNQRGDALAVAGDEPLVFVGPPGSLRGRLPLQNTGDDRLSLRGATIRAEGLPATQAPFVAVLPPGSRTTATAVLALDDATAPGTYDGEVDLGGQRRPARLVVLASAELDLTPGRVVLQQRTSRVTLVVRNDGNVDVALVAVVRADLRRDGRRDADPDDGSATGRLAAPLRLTPGRSEVLELTVELPGNLDPARRYVADLPVGPAVLTLVVAPGATAAARKTAAPPRRTSTPRRSP